MFIFCARKYVIYRVCAERYIVYVASSFSSSSSSSVRFTRCHCALEDGTQRHENLPATCMGPSPKGGWEKVPRGLGESPRN